MALELNAECDICGKKYHICNSCSEVLSLKPWRTVTDTVDHYKIYLALSEYTKTRDKEKAKNELQNCNLSGLENFNKNIREVIEEILSEKTIKKIKTSAKTKINKDNIIE